MGSISPKGKKWLYMKQIKNNHIFQNFNSREEHSA